jgi:predicted phage gp36 major capsid-like protein
VGKRSRNRKTVATSDYLDDDGNVLTLRHSDAKVPDAGGSAAATTEDRARRVAEMRFERYVARWEIAGLPLTKQKELLARYRMADRATQDWVQRTIDRHLESA